MQPLPASSFTPTTPTTPTIPTTPATPAAPAPARLFLAATAALALLLAGTPALAQHDQPDETGNVLIWTPPHTDSGSWDTFSLNWTDASGTNATFFTNGDAVVFGLDANGNPTNETGHVTVSGTVTVGASGANPGVLIGSGSWFFDGGDILGGNFAISSTTTLAFSTGVSGEGQRMFYDQRFEIADAADFTLRLPSNNVSYFTGSNIVEADGGVMRSGANSTITFATNFAGYYYVSNTTSASGGAIYAGENFNVVLQTGHIFSAQEEWNWLNLNFTSNNAGGSGGAIYAVGDITMVAPPSLTGTDTKNNVTNHFTLVFQNNISGSSGGAIFARGNVAISGSAAFSGNNAGATGGAIHSESAVTLGGIATIASNTAAAASAIHATGDITLTGTITIANNTATGIATTSQGGAIHTAANLTMTGSGSQFTFYNNRVTGAHQASSMARVTGTLTLSDHATLFASGGITAREFLITNSTLKIGEDHGAASSALTLATTDPAGAPLAGTIPLHNTTLHASYGTLAVNAGSRIEITGTALIINATGAGPAAIAGLGTNITAGITGAATLIKTGSGNLTLSGSNTCTGPIIIEAGTLRGNIPATSTLTIKTGATLNTRGRDQTLASLSSNGSIRLSENNTAGARLRIAGPLAAGPGGNITLNIIAHDNATLSDQLIIADATATSGTTKILIHFTDHRTDRTRAIPNLEPLINVETGTLKPGAFILDDGLGNELVTLSQRDYILEHTARGVELHATTTADTTAARQLKTQLESPGSETVNVPGEIDLTRVGGATITTGKLIEGATPASTIIGPLTIAATATATIIRGINFTTGTLAITGARDIAITHCTFTDNPVHITAASDNIALTWNKFTATPATPTAGSAILIADSGSATGIHLAHNYFTDGLKTDIPAVTRSRLLMFNNYIATPGNHTATHAGPAAQILSERNIYQNTHNPLTKQNTGLLRTINNYMPLPPANTANTGTIAPGEDHVYVPAYSRLMYPAEDNTPFDAATLATLIAANAGNTNGKYSLPPPTTPHATARIGIDTNGPTAYPTAPTIPPGTTIILTADATGFTPIARQWYLDNFPLTGATADTHTIREAIASTDAGAYSVALTTPAGEIVTSPALTLTIAPTSTTTPGGNTKSGGGGGAPSPLYLAALAALLALHRARQTTRT